MTSTARNHHVLPQAYLGFFTDTGSKNGKFYVVETSSGKCFRTSPKNVAVQRDFNRLDVEGQSLDVLEQSLSSFEARAVEACLNIISSKSFPNDEDYNSLINLIGLIAVRNPQKRESFNRSREMLYSQMGDILVSDKNIFEFHLRRVQESGYVPKTNVSYEEMKEFFEERRYKIQFPPGENSEIEFSVLDHLIPILGQRFWSLLLAPDSGPDFICSDHPVALTFKDAQREGPIGYGLKNTEIFFPISPKMGFYGVYEEPLRAIVNLKPSQIAKMNRKVVESAERQVFSLQDTFLIWWEGDTREVKCSAKIDSPP